MYDIVVLGAGVVGLSTAVNIQDLLPRRHVTVIADSFTHETTSDGAAGIFRPTLQKTPAKCGKQFRRWCADSFRWFHHLNTTQDPAKTGIIRVSGYQLNDEHKDERPTYHDIVYDFRDMTPEELASIPGNKRHGWKYTTLMIECRRYLPWLMQKFMNKGGRIEKRTIADISEFAGKCNVLVNCAGRGAGRLCADDNVFPVRGHLLRVAAPWVKHFYISDSEGTYIYPGQDNVVLGGTRQRGEFDTAAEGPWYDDIVRRSEKLLPGIKNAVIQWKWAGVRPHRTHIRLERETVYSKDTPLQVVHNYGHGANGVGLSWGTAVEAAQIVKNMKQQSSDSLLDKIISSKL